ncbi:MAG: PAS domain S-box protein [Syntrophobacteraceae bacterium]
MAKDTSISLIEEILAFFRSNPDIIECGLPEEALERFGNEFTKVFHASPVAMSISTEEDGRFLDVNPAFEKMSGFSLKELVGKTSIEVGLARPEERAWMIEALKSMGKIRDLEIPFRGRSAGTVFVKISAELIEIAKVRCMLFMAEDITEKRQMQEALKESEKLFSQIFHLSPNMAIITRKADGRTIAVNDAFLGATGFSREKLIGKSTIELGIWGKEEERREFLENFESKGIIQDGEVYLCKKSGERFPVRFSLISVEYKGEPCLFAFGIDITERKKAVEEWERVQSLLRQSQKMEAVGTLAGGIAHDFNNILATIIGYSELAKSDIADGKKINNHLDQILKASLRARDLIKQILTFSRMKSNLELQPLKLTPLIKETIKLLRASIPTTIEIRQKMSCASDTVLADLPQMQQVLVNLAANAAHSMEEKGGVLEVCLRNIELTPDSPPVHPGLVHGKYVMLSVSDTGHGISPEILDRIFEPYFTTKDTGKGTGLGLAMVHGVVQRHGGAVTVQSEPGKGTTFSVYLPRIEEADSAGKQVEGEIPYGTESILLVDDEQELSDVIARILAGLGYRVTARTSPVEALDLFGNDPSQFDLVITDYTMPGLTGAKLAKLIRDKRRDIPIIIATGFSERLGEQEADELSINVLLTKPLRRAELARAVRTALDGEQ